jgi:hypothetical protein
MASNRCMRRDGTGIRCVMPTQEYGLCVRHFAVANRCQMRTYNPGVNTISTDSRCPLPALNYGLCINHRHNYRSTCVYTNGGVECKELDVLDDVCLYHWGLEKIEHCIYVLPDSNQFCQSARTDDSYFCEQHREIGSVRMKASNGPCKYSGRSGPYQSLVKCTENAVRQGYCQAHFVKVYSKTTNRSEKDNKDEEETTVALRDCTICMDKKSNVVFIPCGHMVACYKCAIKVKDVCPICRVTVTNVMKVYL